MSLTKLRPLSSLVLILTVFASQACKTMGQGAVVASATVPAAPGTVTVQLQNSHGTWQGWGASLSWWASTIGGSSFAPTYADLIFTQKTVSLLGKTVPGLGFNVVRYNIGGTGLPGDPPGEVISPQMPVFRQIIGYWPTQLAGAQESQGWHWERDANQRQMMQLAVQRGADQIEFFANAPMWWMADSSSADGGTLLASHINDFTHYLATVVDYATREWGVPVTSVAPFNEPSATWWAYPKNQEGCRVPPPMQPQVLASLRQGLDALGHQNIILAAADENSVQDALVTLQRYQGQQQQSAGVSVPVPSLYKKTNIHGYFGGTNPQRDNGARTAFRVANGGQNTWLSEYTDGDATGLTLATTITQDLYYLQPTAWVYWQPVEPGNAWSFVYGDYNADSTLGQPLDINTKYFVMALFSRTIRPGQTLFDSGDPNTIVGYDATQKHLAIVSLVPGPQQLRYDLSALHSLPGIATVTVTTFDGKSLLASSTVQIQGGQLIVNAAAGGTYAVTLDGVY